MSELPVDLPLVTVKPPTLSARLAFPLVLTVTGAILLGLVLAILRLNNGTFIYTMDDAYIDLALSDQIHHGNYGIEAGLHSAPASSILYPLLLAPASGTPLHPYLPLILNSLALFATLVIVWKLFVHLRLAEETFGIVAQAATLLLLAICLNLIGVVFTGFEHSLHIATVAACVYGLTLFLDKDKMPAWLPAVIVLAPLLRFEGLALSLAAIVVLALRGRWRTALATFALIVLFVGGFSAFLVSLGLPPLPSSVLTKSDIAAISVSGASTGLFHSIGQNVLRMVSHPIGFLLIVIGLAAAVRCLRELPAWPWRWSSQALMALLLVCLVGAHAVAGQFGWLDRYEDYAMLGTALMGIYLSRETIRKIVSNKKERLKFIGLTFIALSVFCSPYILSTWHVPLASNNIYEQQYQMHRFVNDFYRAPVAVNDLGLVSYHNPNFVLDLGGLASEQARILRMSAASAEQYRALVAGSGVHLVIIYDEWFEDQIPASWIKVASMDLSRERVSPAQTEVQFYATDNATASLLQPELQSFSKSLPPGVKLTIYSGAAEAN
ncbi:MAG: hypothetical protein ACLQGT_01760 [Terracidiphilus sp.]